MTLSFGNEIIIGGDGQWHHQIRFNIFSLNAEDSRTRQAFWVKELPTSPEATLEFMTQEDTGFANYSVLL